MNKIIIELSPLDQARLDKLTAALEEMNALIEGTGTTTPASRAMQRLTGSDTTEPEPAPAAKKPAAKKAAEPAEQVKEPEPEPAKAAESEVPAITYKLADVQQAVVNLCSPEKGLKAQVRTIVKQYADKVTNIPEDKFAEVMAKLIELEKDNNGGWCEIQTEEG